MKQKIRLGVNIDHVATLRQARRGAMPSPALAAAEAARGGADGLTAHLREDRRHIQDSDLAAIRKACKLPFNLEMALNPQIIAIALRFRPEHICLVPEKRQELTTEGGLDIIREQKRLAEIIPLFKRKKIRVSLFLDPMPDHIRLAGALGADAVEIHTGSYAGAEGAAQKRELARIQEAARLIALRGMEAHAGHGLDYENTAAVARIPEIVELNIGHSIISRAIFDGMRSAVREMKSVMTKARHKT